MALSSSVGEGARVPLGARGKDEHCAHTRAESFKILLVLNLDWGYNWKEHRQGDPGVNRVWGRCRGGDSAQQRLMTKGLVAGLAPGRQLFRFNGCNKFQ